MDKDTAANCADEINQKVLSAYDGIQAIPVADQNNQKAFLVHIEVNRASCPSEETKEEIRKAVVLILAEYTDDHAIVFFKNPPVLRAAAFNTRLGL